MYTGWVNSSVWISEYPVADVRYQDFYLRYGDSSSARSSPCSTMERCRAEFPVSLDERRQHSEFPALRAAWWPIPGTTSTTSISASVGAPQIFQ